MDKHDIPFLISDIKKYMPNHSKKVTSIPITMDQRFPKNLTDFSNSVNNKFLNKKLSDIEEADYKDLLPNKLKNWFANQQHRYHEKSGVFNHDGWVQKLKSLVPPDHVMACGFLINPFRFSAPVNGADLTSGNADTTDSGYQGAIWSYALSTGTVGHLYDQIALSVTTSALLERLACYNDGSGSPNNLMGETASHSSATGFNFNSMTEFALDTAQNYCAYQIQAGAIINVTTSASFDRFSEAFTFGAFPDPSAESPGTSSAAYMKMGHT